METSDLSWVAPVCIGFTGLVAAACAIGFYMAINRIEYLQKKLYGLVDDSQIKNLLCHNKFQSQARVIDDLRERVVGAVQQAEAISLRVDKHDQASEGFWKTASGHVLRIRDMSDSHIENCLAGGFAGPVSAMRMRRELERRKEDKNFRDNPKTLKTFLVNDLNLAPGTQAKVVEVFDRNREQLGKIFKPAEETESVQKLRATLKKLKDMASKNPRTTLSKALRDASK